MAILNNVELWFVRCDPARPNDKFDKENPTWEVQIRTSSKETKREWQEANLGVKAIVPDEGAPYFKVQLKKGCKKKDKTPSEPIKVVDGDLNPLDPNVIGNGSIGNVRIWQYEYPKEGGGKGIATLLMGIQVTTLKKFERKARTDDDFDKQEMTVIDPPADTPEGTF